jgi:hypothetical protein
MTVFRHFIMSPRQFYFLYFRWLVSPLIPYGVIPFFVVSQTMQYLYKFQWRLVSPGFIKNVGHSCPKKTEFESYSLHVCVFHYFLSSPSYFKYSLVLERKRNFSSGIQPAAQAPLCFSPVCDPWANFMNTKLRTKLLQKPRCCERSSKETMQFFSLTYYYPENERLTNTFRN